MSHFLLWLVCVWSTVHISPCGAAETNLRTRDLVQSHHKNATLVHDIDLVEHYPFGKIAKCFGDCDSSKHCQEGLVCFHREIRDDDDDDLFSVPGCSQTDNEHLHTTNSVCVAPQDLPATAKERTAPIRHTRNLLSQCRGDCDRDSDCNGNLVCYQRGVGDKVPGCPNKNLGTRRDYCVPPQGGNNNKDDNNSNKLGLCQGDCDRDSDCEGNLVCHQRNAYDPIPNGCKGRLSRSTDYCVNSKGRNTGNNDNDNNNNAPEPSGFAAAPAPAPTTTSTKPFQLKIYWQPGYDWQGEYFERKWCLTRDFNVGGRCWHGTRAAPCYSDRVYVTKCRNGSNQQFNFEFVNNDEVLIKVYKQDRCLHRSGVQISLRKCDPSSKYQQFFAPRGGLDQYRFELSQKSAYSYCLNQDHHPKGGEYVQMFPCTWTRAWDSLTSYWEKY